MVQILYIFSHGDIISEGQISVKSETTWWSDNFYMNVKRVDARSLPSSKFCCSST